MLIGDALKKRMAMLSISDEELSEKTLIDIDILKDIITNKLELNCIDEFDLNVLASTLYCEPEYFFDAKERDKDVMSSCYNRGDETQKSTLAKVKIQKIVKDIVFLREVLN